MEEPTEEPMEEPTEEPTPVPEPEQVTVRYLMWGQVSEWEDAMCQEFEAANPDINVDYVVGDPTKVLAMLAAADAPDIWWANTVGLLATEGHLLNLTPFIDNDPEYQEYMDDFIPSLLDTYRFGGDLYGLPKDANAWCIRCNLTLFEQSGIDPPEPGWTWDDMMTKAAAINDLGDDIYGLMHGFWLPGWWDCDYTTWIHQNGTRCMTDDGLLGLDQPEAMEALEYLYNKVHVEQVSTTGAYLGTLGTDWTVQILEGTLGMAYDLTGGAIAAFETGNEDNTYRQLVSDGNYTVAALPVGAVESNTLYNGGFVAWGNTPNPEATYRLIKYVCGAPGIEAVLRASSNLPANKSIDWVALNMAKPGFAADEAMMQAVFQSAGTGLLPFNRNDPRWDDVEVAEKLGTSLDDVLNQGNPPAEVIPPAVTEINERMVALAEEG
jgi:multiple sugar transport system substrate-binding protein